MRHLKGLLFIALTALAGTVGAQAPAKIFSYAIGDWRNGPVVAISPVFETTEQFTTIQLINRVKKEFPAFKDIADIDIQRFADAEEANESRIILKGKYERRKLEVNMVETPVSNTVAPVPAPSPSK